jgi:hypothetical protein
MIRLSAEVTATALKAVLARQVEAAMKEKRLPEAEMTGRMAYELGAPRDRLPDPEYEAVGFSKLRKAALVLGREFRLELV